jgi:hypothetical protein
MCRGKAYGQAGNSTTACDLELSRARALAGMRWVPIATLGDEAMRNVMHKAIV